MVSSSTINEIYHGASSIGRVETLMTAIFLTVFSIALISFGMFLAFSHPDKEAFTRVIATAQENSSCHFANAADASNMSITSSSSSAASSTTWCRTLIQYIDPKTKSLATYNLVTLATNKTYTKGQQFPVALYPETGLVTDMFPSTPSRKSRIVFGVIIALFGIVLSSIGWISFYYSRKSQAYSAMMGADAVIGSTANALHI